jgi:hypothetical protein
MKWAGKISPFITSTTGLLPYCPDVRPARVTFALTQELSVVGRPVLVGPTRAH